MFNVGCWKFDVRLFDPPFSSFPLGLLPLNCFSVWYLADRRSLFFPGDTVISNPGF
jgi:hypothetical protein